MKAPTWIYHQTHAPKIVDAGEVEQYKRQGWTETPAAFQTPAQPIKRGKRGKA